MLTSEERFAQLRDILIQSPSQKRFVRLTELIDDWEDTLSRKQAIAYASEHLHLWPLSTRSVEIDQGKWPAECYDANVGLWPDDPEGSFKPSFPLIRGLMIPFRGLQKVELQRWHEASYFSSLRALDLIGNDLDAEDIHLLTHAPSFGELKRLSLSCQSVDQRSLGVLFRAPSYNNSAHCRWRRSLLIFQPQTISNLSPKQLHSKHFA